MRWLIQDIMEAAQAMLRRPAQSLLNGLGIGIGVAAMVAMLSIGEGAKTEALKKIRSLGIDTLRLETAVKDDPTGQQNLSNGLRYSDIRRLKALLREHSDISAYVRHDRILVQSGNLSLVTTVLGVEKRWFAAESLSAARGRLLQDIDFDLAGNTCVVGPVLAGQLQLNRLGISESPHLLQYGGGVCSVVGILEPRGRLLTEGTGLSSLDFDSLVVLPMNSFASESMASSGTAQIDGIVIKHYNEAEGIEPLSTRVESLLLALHRGVGDFTLVVPLRLLQEARVSHRNYSLILGTIAGLTLLVGGIGLMNMLLANVAEQTREIGLRVALGATRQRIVSLYLFKSVMLVLMGSGWGVLFGMMIARAVQAYAGWEIIFSPFSLLAGPTVAVITSVIFAIYPALRAAGLDPVIALRES